MHPSLEAPEALREAPPEIEVSVPEGFAYYALDPELYRTAARQFVRDNAASRVAVIGIRSIGATLSSVVESELRAPRAPDGFLDGAASRASMGPRAERLRFTGAAVARVGRRLRHCGRRPGPQRVVFRRDRRNTARAWRGRRRRSVFFTSWNADPDALVSARARDQWRRHRRYCAAFEELGLFETQEISPAASGA